MHKCPTDITTKCWEGKHSRLWPPSQTCQNKIMLQCSALEVLRGFGSWMPIRIHYLESFKKYWGLNPTWCRLARSPGYKLSGRQGRKPRTSDSCSTLITYRTSLELQWLDQRLNLPDPRRPCAGAENAQTLLWGNRGPRGEDWQRLGHGPSPSWMWIWGDVSGSHCVLWRLGFCCLERGEPLQEQLSP